MQSNWTSISSLNLLSKLELMCACCKQGLAKELAHEGACENAIYPEAVFVQDRCAFPAGMIQQGVCILYFHSLGLADIWLALWSTQLRWCLNSLHLMSSMYCNVEFLFHMLTISFVLFSCPRHVQGDRCDLDIVPGCTDPESPFFDPLANVDDGSCPYISDGEN